MNADQPNAFLICVYLRSSAAKNSSPNRHLFVHLDLRLMQLGVHAAGLVDEIGVRAFFDDFALLQHDQSIGRLQGAEAVGDRECRPPFDQPIEGLLDLLFRFRIDGAGRFVEDQDARIVQDRPSDADALAFAAR